VPHATPLPPRRRGAFAFVPPATPRILHVSRAIRATPELRCRDACAW
jgi:hypothetical protein